MSARAVTSAQAPVRPLGVPGRGLLQRSLAIGRADDALEREADQRAAQIVVPAPHATGAQPPARAILTLRRKCAACEEEERRLQRHATDSPPTAAPRSVDATLSQPGTPLPASLRAFMEPRFAADFSRVRIHTGPAAERSAAEVNAHAYTVGRDIAFSAGAYAPDTVGGRTLIAHELTHVVQQGAAATVDETRQTVRSSIGHRLQRSCGPAVAGAGTGCTPLQGDEVGESFYFKVACDDFQPVEQARLELFAGTLHSGDQIGIHGYASEEGDPGFNELLSCARAHRAQAIIAGVLTGRGIAAGIDVYNHGATPGARPGRRSIVVTLNSAAPSTGPTPAPTVPTPAVPVGPAPALSSCNPGQTAMITSHIAPARDWVNDAEPKISAVAAGTAAPAVSAVVTAAISANFHTTAPADVATIATNFAALRGALAGALAMECVSAFWCNPTDLAYVRGRFAAIRRLGDVNLCPAWFACADYFTRVTTIPHEVAHQYPGADDKAYEWEATYASLSTADAIDNAESYAVTARQIYHGGTHGPGTGGTC